MEEITQGQEKNHLKGLMEQLPEITHSLSNNSLKSIGRSTQKHFAIVVTKLALDDIVLCSQLAKFKQDLKGPQYFQVTQTHPRIKLRNIYRKAKISSSNSQQGKIHSI